MPLYKIIFKDTTTVFLGGDTLKDSKWNKIPNREILRLEYFLDKNSCLILQNFEAYAVFTEATKNPIGPIGNCPKCNKKAKLSRVRYKMADGKEISKIIARCKDEKCKWVGKVEDLKNRNNSKSIAEYKYVMGLKNGIVTSYRITLEGKKGTDKYEKGDVTKRNYPKGEELRGKPVADWVWKKGIK